MSMQILLGRPCATVGDHLQFQVPVEVEPIDRSGAAVVVADGSQLAVDAFRLDESWMLRVSGSVALEMRCDRCLESAAINVPISFQAEVVEEFSASEVEDALVLTRKGSVDLSERVREQIILAVPLKVLCQSNCQGLCPQCGQDLNQGSCECDVSDIDPRLEGLAELKAKLIETKKN